MPVFPILKVDDVVQVGDQTRISATTSFVTPGGMDIEKVEIQPAAGEPFFDVTNTDKMRWYLDWIYSLEGPKTVTLRLTQVDASDPQNPFNVVTENTGTIRVKTAADEYLFSTDQDLVALEPDILKWIPEGYSSWNHVHRQAQRSIMDWLDEIRFFGTDGRPYSAAQLVSREQVRRLSTMTALRMIYSILSNQVGDVFVEKAREYRKAEENARNRNYLTVDSDGDGTPDVGGAIDLRTVTMVRR